MVKIYEDYMAKVAIHLGAKPRVAAEQMKRVMQLEFKLAQVCILYFIAVFHVFDFCFFLYPVYTAQKYQDRDPDRS